MQVYNRGVCLDFFEAFWCAHALGGGNFLPEQSRHFHAAGLLLAVDLAVARRCTGTLFSTLFTQKSPGDEPGQER